MGRASFYPALSIQKSVLNKSYLTDLYIVFTLKMESVPKIIIFGLKMMVRTSQKWSRKNIFEIPPWRSKTLWRFQFEGKTDV
jgi:hypothetical protein